LALRSLDPDCDAMRSSRVRQRSDASDRISLKEAVAVLNFELPASSLQLGDSRANARLHGFRDRPELPLGYVVVAIRKNLPLEKSDHLLAP